MLPTLDYSYTPDEPIAGGELSFNVNAREIVRDELDSVSDGRADWCAASRAPTAASLPKPNGRSRSSPGGGMVVTPLLEVRGDAGYADMTDEWPQPSSMRRTRWALPPTVRSELYRWMATAGLEWRWPVLFSSTSSTHILEPMAQVFARPDEQYVACAWHSQRGCAELRLRCLHAVRARQVLRL